MSDLEHVGTVSPREDDGAAPLDDLAARIGNRPLVPREGLPQGYRMRADAHYVDQLESRQEGRVIRLIPIEDIEAIDTASAGSTALTRSIATHGVLQPLLVRRHDGGYHLMAGRKRLAAATLAGLHDVPCLVYDADDARAAALADADNLRDGSAPDPLPAAARLERFGDVIRALSSELAPLNSSAALLKRAASKSLQHRVAVDLMVAQAWRAAWLANAAVAVLGDPSASRPKPVHSVFDSVKAGFAAEARVSALQLNFSVAPDAAGVPIDEDLAVLAISGAVFATLALLQAVDDPQIEVHADVPNSRTLKIEIVQRMVPLSPEGLETFRDSSALGSGDLTTAIGLRTMRAFAAESGGTFEASAMKGRGSLIQATACRR